MNVLWHGHPGRAFTGWKPVPQFHIHRAFEGFMDAVLAPGLRDCFEFNVGGLSTEFLKVFLNRLHLDQIQKQVLFFAQRD
ncbi:hypothetical protein ES703_109983 [subsurface metagenome]